MYSHEQGIIDMKSRRLSLSHMYMYLKNIYNCVDYFAEPYKKYLKNMYCALYR